MISENVIIFGLGTVGMELRKDEPNKVYFIKIEACACNVGQEIYKVEDTLPIGDIEAHNVETPLNAVRVLYQAESLGKTVVDMGGFIMDFTRDKAGESFELARIVFMEVANRMAQAQGMDRNQFSKLRFEIVGE